MNEPLQIFVYVVTFLAMYVQVFFLLTFLSERKKIKTAEKESSLKEFPKITFLVPCWNEEGTVINTIKSLLEIDYPKDNFFIFAINDGSTDKTLSILNESFKNHPQIKVLTKENGGKHTALNFAMKKVETELMATVDADTYLEPKGIQRAVEFFIKDKNLSAVGGSVLIRNPKSIAQKAQSIEYQMFSFSKKILGLLGGVLVVPGAFSVFKTKDLIKAGGYRRAHNLEDLELTFRLQEKGFKVDHCHTALAYTKGPDSVKSLFKQRLRWGYGFVHNAYDYRKVILNRKYGNFGLFTVPMSILSYIVIVSIFFVSWLNIFSFLVDKYMMIKLIGIRSTIDGFGFSWFFLNTKAIAIISVVMYLAIVLFIYLGRKISKVNDRKYGSIIWFFLLYSLVVPIWVLKTLYNSVFSRRPSWR